MQLCSGTNWLNFPTNGTMGSCTAGNLGKLEFDTTNKVFRYCNGSNWQRSEAAPCTVSSISHVAKIAADSTALNQVSAAVLSPDGQYLYTGGDRITKWSFSAATPAVPVKVGHSATAAAMGIAQELRIHGNHVFAIGQGGSITSWNISGTTPTLASSRSHPGIAGDGNGLVLSADGTKAYVVTPLVASGAQSHLVIFDISNPASIPVALGSLNITSSTGNLVQNVEIFGTTLFANFRQDVSDYGGIVAINVSNPAAPTVISRVANANMFSVSAFAISPDGQYAYMANNSSSPRRMSAVSIGNPAAMSQVGGYYNTEIQESYDGKLVGNYFINTNVYGTCQVMVTNVTNPASPSLVASDGNCSTKANGPGAFVVRGRYVYTANYSDHTISTFTMSCDPLDGGPMGSCSTAGQIDYNTSTRTLLYCDGANWKVMAK